VGTRPEQRKEDGGTDAVVDGEAVAVHAVSGLSIGGG
jgi:hypothetical protein